MGFGKLILINIIFVLYFIEFKGRLFFDEIICFIIEIQFVLYIIEENGVCFRFNIVDIFGYGDFINNDRCWDFIVKYIKDQYLVYFCKEFIVQCECYIQDMCIYCCLFFIQLLGYFFKFIDIVVFKKFFDVVNVVFVIVKFDFLILEECMVFKECIKEEFVFYNFKMYFYDNEEFDDEECVVNSQIKVC